ncbi:MAG: SpaH/EbpB family LPXTG-anchored major pilin [Actinomycetaceae bacterium]|nr:SpaH/EbpB family LPXTG-anchored major pilin [Arcanobacterium sp.]MDD7505687.1 SpaH/EbpB family LPXTG-anchored major pilin [Actinomycetaceae bacterium]MDY6143175.1 SpaH/EbpB family LPXTG-anchored major pilin [Arcanobacterium sp.]
MTTLRIQSHKILVALIVAALALFGAGAVAPVAFAADGNIDANRTGSLTVHKYANPATGTMDPDGTGTSPSTDPIAGVVFSYAKVTDVNLATNEGWTAVQSLTVDADGKVAGTGGTEHATDPAVNMDATNAQGEATVSGLPIGVYLVQEVSAPATVTTKSAPFLVTIPYPDTQQGWLYDVHVYPKNTVLTSDETPLKVVDNPGAVHFPGETISWTITQKIPQLAADETLTAFTITDQLPTGVNTVNTSDVTVTLADAAGQPVTAQPSVSVSDDNVVAVTYDDLAVLKSGYTVTVKISAVVSEGFAGSLSNQSITNINGVEFKSAPAQDVEPTPTVTVFSSLTINKVDGEDKALDGATFTIQPANANGDGPDPAYPAKTLTTANGGTLTQTLAVGNYWVTETKAPTGFEIAPEWKNGKLVTVSADATTQTVTNVKTDTSRLPDLPLTGAQGLILLTILGIAIVAIAIGTGFVSVRRSKIQN